MANRVGNSVTNANANVTLSKSARFNSGSAVGSNCCRYEVGHVDWLSGKDSGNGNDNGKDGISSKTRNKAKAERWVGGDAVDGASFRKRPHPQYLFTLFQIN